MKIGAQIEGDSLDLEVFLKERPRVNNWDFEGISKGKKKDLLEKLKLKRAANIGYIIDKNKKLIKAYWSEKAFRNTEVDVRITNDTLRPQMVNVTFLIDRKNKVKIGKINFTGNEQDSRTRRLAPYLQEEPTRRASTFSAGRSATKRLRRGQRPPDRLLQLARLP